MTLVFGSEQDAADVPMTHAFVIGVGDYPHAKAGRGTDPDLRGVRDLPSAADSAKVMCDWLIANRDRLAPRLGSLEVLISDVPDGGSRYVPRTEAPAGGIDRATGERIEEAGKRWVKRIRRNPGSSALFYCCGHGANHGTLPVLFHSDLNLDEGADAYAHLNIGTIAQAFRQIATLASAFFFVDACGEFVSGFPPGVKDDGFISAGFPGKADRDKVWLVSAASPALQAYPGTNADDFEPESDARAADGSAVKLGRFTQALLRGLNGASARWDGTGWSVDSMALWNDLRPLHRAYFPSWKDRPFEPSQFMTPNDRYPIIRHEAPRFPVLVTTDPAHRASDFDFAIALTDDGTQPFLDSRAKRDGTVWLTHVVGDRSRPFYTLALDGGGVCHSSFFKAEQPQFDQRVPIP